ncbi:MAG: ExbD/TolR family protein [Labilithrix sp.]|nr:ExbD/TolR family protein [Labilithrix sp.]MBX3211498.1 ExbD/TolR family protein [Labilithrix sp.]MBX3223683.1 ExbD/TolR family protein [Labilithrix sp.]
MGGGGGGGGRRRRMGGMNEINVTPLIDVMLVLLVIFMVTAPLLTTGVQVDLPKVKSAPMQTDDSKMLVIVTADEHVYLGKDEITAAIEDRLKTNARLQEEKELYVQADENVKYGVVLRVMAAARSAGVEKLGMVTDPLVVK